MGQGKRKGTDAMSAESSPASTPAGPSSPVTPAHVNGSSRKKEKKARIIWQLADGPGRWQKESSALGSLERTLPKVMRKLGAPETETIRLCHARDIGRFVDIHDDFDFQSLKARAEATQTDQVVFVRVGPYEMQESPWSARSPLRPSSGSPSFPHQSPSPFSISVKARSKRKRSSEPGASSLTASPSVSTASPSGPPPKKRKKQIKGRESLPSSAPTTPDPPTIVNKPLSLAQRYKPVKSSPLVSGSLSQHEDEFRVPAVGPGRKTEIVQGTDGDAAAASAHSRASPKVVSSSRGPEKAVAGKVRKEAATPAVSTPLTPSDASKPAPKSKGPKKKKGKGPPDPPLLLPVPPPPTVPAEKSITPATKIIDPPAGMSESPLISLDQNMNPTHPPAAGSTADTAVRTPTSGSHTAQSTVAPPKSGPKGKSQSGRQASPVISQAKTANAVRNGILGAPAADVLATISKFRSPERPLSELPIPAIPASFLSPGTVTDTDPPSGGDVLKSTNGAKKKKLGKKTKKRKVDDAGKTDATEAPTDGATSTGEPGEKINGESRSGEIPRATSKEDAVSAIDSMNKAAAPSAAPEPPTRKQPAPKLTDAASGADPSAEAIATTQSADGPPVVPVPINPEPTLPPSAVAGKSSQKQKKKKQSKSEQIAGKALPSTSLDDTTVSSEPSTKREVEHAAAPTPTGTRATPYAESAVEAPETDSARRAENSADASIAAAKATEGGPSSQKPIRSERDDTRPSLAPIASVGVETTPVDNAVSTSSTPSAPPDIPSAPVGAIISAKATSSTSRKPIGARARKLPCTICLQTPFHMQRDCPAVVGGRVILKELQDKHSAQYKVEQDTAKCDELMESIKDIQSWLTKFDANQAVRRAKANDKIAMNSEPGAEGEESSRVAKSMPQATEHPAPAVSHQTASPQKPDGVSPKILPESQVFQLTTTTGKPAQPVSKAPSQSGSDSDSSSQSARSVPDPLHDLVGPPASRPSSPRSLSSIARIHQLAMRNARGPGSADGISVSDAVIETGSSASESRSTSGSADDSDTDSDSDSSSASEARSRLSPSPEDDVVSRPIAGEKGSKTAIGTDPPLDLTSFLSRPLSQAQAKRVQEQAATIDLMPEDEEDDDVKMGVTELLSLSSNSPSPSRRLSRGVAEREESVVGSFTSESDGDEPQDSVEPPPQTLPTLLSADSDVQTNSMEHAPAAEPVPDEAQAVPQSTPSNNGTYRLGNRSFRSLDRTSASREFDNSPGTKALEDGMEEERTPQPIPHLELPNGSPVPSRDNSRESSIASLSSAESCIVAEVEVAPRAAKAAKSTGTGKTERVLKPAAVVSSAAGGSQNRIVPPSPARSTKSAAPRPSTRASSAPRHPTSQAEAANNEDNRPKGSGVGIRTPSQQGSPGPTRRSQSRVPASVSPLAASRRLNAMITHHSDELGSSRRDPRDEIAGSLSSDATRKAKRPLSQSQSQSHNAKIEQSQDSPLFMSQPSSQLKTQAYPTSFTSQPVESQCLSSVANGTSAGAQRPNGSSGVGIGRSTRERSVAHLKPPKVKRFAAVSSAKDTDDETDDMSVSDLPSETNVPESLLSLSQFRPAATTPTPRRAAAPSASFTSLSQLPKDLLYAGRDNFASAFNSNGATAKTANNDGKRLLRKDSDVRTGSSHQVEDSESEKSSSGSDSDSDVLGVKGTEGSGQYHVRRRWAGAKWSPQLNGLMESIVEKGW